MSEGSVPRIGDVVPRAEIEAATLAWIGPALDAAERSLDIEEVERLKHVPFAAFVDNLASRPITDPAFAADFPTYATARR